MNVCVWRMHQKGLESHHHCEERDIPKYQKSEWRTMILPFSHLGVFTCSSDFQCKWTYWGLQRRGICLEKNWLSLYIIKIIQISGEENVSAILSILHCCFGWFDGPESPQDFGMWWFHIGRLFDITILLLHVFKTETVHLFKPMSFATAYVSPMRMKCQEFN